ncbi:hypothetical protein HDU76_009562 [Blyttiomyces sp. JEL0837]|nr:hypothetical protein HDU76_009562 [Blyttiomyces sp. JEL0837]
MIATKTLLTTFTILLTALTTQTLAAFTDTANLGITYQATSLGSNKAQICITAKNIDNSTWIGLGVPADAAKPIMLGADIVIVYANSSDASGVSVLHGYGITEKGENDVEDLSVGGDDEVDVAGMKSSYKNNVLTACFTRPMTIPAPTGNATEFTPRNISDSVTNFIWATGKMVDGDAEQHTMKGSIKNVNLFGDLAAASTTGNGTTVTTTPAAKSRGENMTVVFISWIVCVSAFLSALLV